MTAFEPMWVTAVDLAVTAARREAPARPDGTRYERARVLVRHGDDPLGLVDVPLRDGGLDPADVTAAARDLPPGPGQAEAPGLDPVPTSVIVCTHERPDSLRVALRSLLALDDDHFELIVVDNAPKGSATADVVAELADPRMRRVVEPVPGLSTARNCGARAATGELLAFTDDDVIADPGWLRGLRRGFTRAPHVGCVTGIVPAAELETREQWLFEVKAGWSQSFAPRVYDLDHGPGNPLHPFLPGTFGAGANFALRAGTFAAVGPFDEALGAGTRTKGGEDLDYFTRVILAGQAIAYEPAALVWHVHRRDAGAFRSQLAGYGSGLGAYVFKFATGRDTRADVLRRVPRGLARVAATSRHDRDDLELPRDLARTELRGLAAGPLAYVRSRRALEARHGR